MIFRIGDLFAMYFFFDTYSQVLIKEKYEINFILLTIAVVASIIGSTVQATHLSLKKRLTFKDVIAIYSSGILIAYISYEAGHYYESIHLTGLASAIFSYISIEFILAMKKLILYFIDGVSKRLPAAFIKIIVGRYGGSEEKRDDDYDDYYNDKEDI